MKVKLLTIFLISLFLSGFVSPVMANIPPCPCCEVWSEYRRACVPIGCGGNPCLRTVGCSCCAVCWNDPTLCCTSSGCADRCGGSGGPCCAAELKACCPGGYGPTCCTPGYQGCCNGQCYDKATQGCCGGEIYNLATQKCCDDGSNEWICDYDNCYDCNYTTSACESRCKPENCEECDGNGNCIVCDGDANLACCNGQCYDTRTQKCCYDTGNPYICNINETCCESKCCDPANCELCCNGKCCDESNCEICKNGSCIRAVPTNMHQTYVRDLGNGVLYFRYAWESTTGDLADLGNCSVREKVDYPGGNPYYWPSPPWYCGTDNPTILPVPPVPGTYGGLQDTHSPGYLAPPYQAASFAAMQVYQYHCGPNCCMGPDQWDTLLEIGPIMRFVTGDGSLWRYSIIKSGVYAEWFPLP